MKHLAIVLLLCAGAAAQERMSPELLWELGRVSGGSISPDGQTVLYSVRHYDLQANSGDSDLWLVPIGGGDATKLTTGPGSEGAAQWVTTPAGPRVFVLAAKGDSGRQAWAIDPADRSWTQVTNVAGGIGNLKVSPTGKHLAFTREIKLDSTVNEVYPDLPKADARIIDGLLYRHWDQWHDYRYTHLHVAPLGADMKAGQATDLMAGLKADCPIPPFGGASQFNWAPDGQQIAFSMKLVENFAESTDSDVWLVDMSEPTRRRLLTPGMDGYDMEPTYSPDGKWIAFQSMERPSFESDRNRIMLFERATGKLSELTVGLDQTTHGTTWAPDSSAVMFMSERRGTNQIFQLALEGKVLTQITRGRFNWRLADVSPDGQHVVLGRQSMLRPWELFSMNLGSRDMQRLTDVNGAVYAKLELPSIEERYTRASDGKMIHSWVIKPPGFDPAKKHPLITYCQGGPQGQIGQWFSFRWNFHLMASQGYVIVAPNRRGLPGFGREWNDQISGDWGGQAMQDILAATDDLRAESWIDTKRTAAVGASFGGYTVYWLMGKHEDRFQAMISHCGVFNLESMYGSTEELFFVNWDLGGPYWRSKEVQADYDRFSPHKFVRNWKTPLLVIHGEKDFRVPVTQGMEAFTVAQVEGVPSRFLYFPEEGHWVLSPQNGVVWHRVFFDWLHRWTKPSRN